MSSNRTKTAGAAKMNEDIIVTGGGSEGAGGFF